MQRQLTILGTISVNWNMKTWKLLQRYSYSAYNQLSTFKTWILWCGLQNISCLFKQLRYYTSYSALMFSPLQIRKEIVIKLQNWVSNLPLAYYLNFHSICKLATKQTKLTVIQETVFHARVNGNRSHLLLSFSRPSLHLSFSWLANSLTE